ncbi:uncharacterized protein [Macaca nemestrina]|uniref:uncharacterized protein isoform X2 n=1 Tax=Macaca nemestrina TaxID=9545 RepID=UPI0039B8E45E
MRAVWASNKADLTARRGWVPPPPPYPPPPPWGRSDGTGGDPRSKMGRGHRSGQRALASRGPGARERAPGGERNPGLGGGQQRRAWAACNISGSKGDVPVPRKH